MLLTLVASTVPAFAQVTVVFAGGASFRFSFMTPARNEAEAGKIFEIIAFAEHVPGSPAATLIVRVTSTPSPIVIPILPTSGEFPQYCDPNWCTFVWMTGGDQESVKMKFMIDSNAPPGQILILKVDATVTSSGLFQNVEDIRINVVPPLCPAGMQRDPVTGQCIVPPQPCPTGTHHDPVTNTCIPDIPPDFTINVQDLQPQQVEAGQSATTTIVINTQNWRGDTITLTVSAPGLVASVNPSSLTTSGTCSLSVQVPNDAKDGIVPIKVVASGAGKTHEWSGALNIKGVIDWTWVIMGIVIALVAVGIVAVFLLTRKKPSPTAGAYKPYQTGLAVPQAVALKPGVPQAVKPVTHVPRVVARREEKK